MTTHIRKTYANMGCLGRPTVKPFGILVGGWGEGAIAGIGKAG